jgi:hypothetical protein
VFTCANPWFLKNFRIIEKVGIKSESRRIKKYEAGGFFNFRRRESGNEQLLEKRRRENFYALLSRPDGKSFGGDWAGNLPGRVGGRLAPEKNAPAGGREGARAAEIN